MCSSGNSVPSPRAVTQAEKDAALKAMGPRPTGLPSVLWDAKKAELDDNLIVPPPSPPDPFDELVQRAARARRLRMLSGQGIGQNYLTGPGGLTTPAPTFVPKLGGA